MKTITLLTISLLVSLTSFSFADHDHLANHCQRRVVQEWVQPHWTVQQIPAQYRWTQVWDSCRRCYVRKQVLVAPACQKKVWVAGRYINKTKWVCHSAPRPIRCSCQKRFISSYQQCGTPVYSWSPCNCKQIVRRTCGCQKQFVVGYQPSGHPIYSYSKCGCSKRPIHATVCSCKKRYVSGYQPCGTPIFSYRKCNGHCKKKYRHRRNRRYNDVNIDVNFGW